MQRESRHIEARETSPHEASIETRKSTCPAKSGQSRIEKSNSLCEGRYQEHGGDGAVGTVDERTRRRDQRFIERTTGSRHAPVLEASMWRWLRILPKSSLRRRTQKRQLSDAHVQSRQSAVAWPTRICGSACGIVRNERASRPAWLLMAHLGVSLSEEMSSDGKKNHWK